MATGSGVLLGFGRGVGLPGANPQPSSTVASLSCTESPSCVFSDSLRSGSRDCSPSLCVCLTSMGFCVHLFTFKNKTKQNRVSVCSPPWSGICSPPASASQTLQSLRPVHAPFPPHTHPQPLLFLVLVFSIAVRCCAVLQQLNHLLFSSFAGAVVNHSAVTHASVR